MFRFLVVKYTKNIEIFFREKLISQRKFSVSNLRSELMMDRTLGLKQLKKHHERFYCLEETRSGEISFSKAFQSEAGSSSGFHVASYRVYSNLTSILKAIAPRKSAAQ